MSVEPPEGGALSRRRAITATAAAAAAAAAMLAAQAAFASYASAQNECPPQICQPPTPIAKEAGKNKGWGDGVGGGKFHPKK